MRIVYATLCVLSFFGSIGSILFIASMHCGIPGGGASYTSPRWLPVASLVPRSCQPTKRLHPKNRKGFIPYTVQEDDAATFKSGPHYNFRRDLEQTVKEYIALHEDWHESCHALDVGGRNGELQDLFEKCVYRVLERDPPKDEKQRAFTVTCDLFNCVAIPLCSWDIILMRNVLEHVMDPKLAVEKVTEWLKPGGLLAIWSPWTWRYHANPTYGDYYRYSARAMEYLCISAGLNPVNSFYQHYGQEVKKLSVGTLHLNGGLDVPPVPYTVNLEAGVICYKPRTDERLMVFEEVGTKPVANHPRFYLDYSSASSEMPLS